MVVVQENTSLTAMDLRRNEIGPESELSLEESLRCAPFLLSLSIAEGNRVSKAALAVTNSILDMNAEVAQIRMVGS